MGTRELPLTGRKILLAGGSRARIEIRPLGQLMWGDDNPGSISIRYGGLIFEMASSLSALGAEVCFVSVGGDDFAGRAAKELLASAGVDVSGFHLISGMDTAAKGNIMNLLDQPEISFGDETVHGRMTSDMMSLALSRHPGMDLIVTDTCFPVESLMPLADAAGNPPLFLCPSGASNPETASALLSKAEGTFMSREMAQALSGNDVLSEEQLFEAGRILHGYGPSQVFISLAAGGVFYQQEGDNGIARPGKADAARIVEGFLLGNHARETAWNALVKEE